ncbi:protein FAM83G [Megalops cyprinoides]|uniref:protein FAM83G n=1 Tax=Megalops cyprinoides TaxID=118141 RepID=UPI001864000F|nr:protein FAM83G [Megalops cyprinoides]
MALSQIQCLDDNHVNWRLNESKPEFFYSEDQRLALEALLEGGRGAFEKYTQAHQVREFLSELELEQLLRTAEDYKPGSDHSKGDVAGDSEDGAVSLQYWPERSDISIPDLDMGWPDSSSYRGVTRVNVYTQPPLEGQQHIKEVVRKTIAQANKVIAVVMDLFTDVDIFRDLLDASFKRKVAVYIILEASAVPHFLSMCGRAGMHRGHLKNLRVRYIGGTEFYTRSSKKVHGSMSQKFMFVDGDRTVSGSYSFTWMASRLDRNLITVLTGQAVETFDKQFRELYLMSRGVNLSKINLEDEPEPEPLPQAAPVPLPSAAVARKLINPKYALVSSNAVETGSRTSSDKNSAKNSSSNNPMIKVPLRAKIEPVEAPPLHPGLVNLERAYLIHYLPTWPEPDPPSDVIGFINIRDSNKPMQAHLMRSELFEISQAVRFKDPFVLPQESLPEKAVPRGKTENPTTDAPAVPEQQQAQPQLQKTHGETEKSVQPSNQTQSPGDNQGRTDMLPPPVPKPRTVQLVISDTASKDAPDVAMVKMPCTDISTPQTIGSHNPGQTSDKHSDPSDNTLTAVKAPSETTDNTLIAVTPPSEPTDNTLISVTQPSEPGTEDEGDGDVDLDDQEEELKAIGTEADSNEAGNAEVPHTQSPRDESNISTPSDEYFECSESDILESRIELIANGTHTGSGRFEDHRQSDGLNVMARFSQSMLDLRPENQLQLQQKAVHTQRALADIRLALERKEIQVHQKLPCGNGRKLYQTSSRSPASTIRGEWESQGRGTAKVVLAKPGCYHRPAKAAGPVIGGHKYWQGKLFSQDKSSSGRCSPNRLAQMQLANSRTGRSPSRHGSPYRQSQGQSGRPSHHCSPQRPHATQGDSRAPFGISFAKLSQFKHLKGKMSGTPMQNKKAQLGQKGTS